MKTTTIIAAQLAPPEGVPAPQPPVPPGSVAPPAPEKGLPPAPFEIPLPPKAKSTEPAPKKKTVKPIDQGEVKGLAVLVDQFGNATTEDERDSVYLKIRDFPISGTTLLNWVKNRIARRHPHPKDVPESEMYLYDNTIAAQTIIGNMLQRSLDKGSPLKDPVGFLLDMIGRLNKNPALLEDARKYEAETTGRAISNFKPYIDFITDGNIERLPIPAKMSAEQREVRETGLRDIRNYDMPFKDKVLEAYKFNEFEKGQPGRVEAAKRFWDDMHLKLQPMMDESHKGQLVSAFKPDSFFHDMISDFRKLAEKAERQAAQGNSAILDEMRKAGLSPEMVGKSSLGKGTPNELDTQMLSPAAQYVRESDIERAIQKPGYTKSIDQQVGGEEGTFRVDISDPKSLTPYQLLDEEEERPSFMDPGSEWQKSLDKIRTLDAKADIYDAFKNEIVPLLQQDLHKISAPMQLQDYKTSKYFMDMLDEINTFTDEAFKKSLLGLVEPLVEHKNAELEGGSVPPRPAKEYEYDPAAEPKPEGASKEPKEPRQVNPAALFDKPVNAQPYLANLPENEQLKAMERGKEILNPTKTWVPEGSGERRDKEKAWREAIRKLSNLLYPATQAGAAEPSLNPLFRMVGEAMAENMSMIQGASASRKKSVVNSFVPVMKWFENNKGLFDNAEKGGLWSGSADLKEKPWQQPDLMARFQWVVARVVKDFFRAMTDDKKYQEIKSLMTSPEMTSLGEVIHEIRTASFAWLGSMMKIG